MTSTESVATETNALLARLGVDRVSDAAATTAAIARAETAFRAWRNVPAPRRGELIRLLGEELRAAKDDLGRLVSIEAGKILS